MGDIQAETGIPGSTLSHHLEKLKNDELVTVRFYHWFSWQAPLIFLLLIAFAAGAAAGLLAGVFRSARLKRQLSRLRKEGRRAPASRPRDGG